MTQVHTQDRKSWANKVLSADAIYAQVKLAAEQAGIELPKTPRRPDIRLIVENITGMDQIFANPANHAGDKAEVIPPYGDERAAMIMLAGDTLEEQQEAAAQLFARFDLGNKGLSADFVAAIKADRAGGLVREAYGPAPLQAQADKLNDIVWTQASGHTATINPVKGIAAAFGARAADKEIASTIKINIAVQGTSTIAETVEGTSMVVAVSSDWQTGAISTRPIVPSVAQEFYGEHYAVLPIATVTPDGLLQRINLGNGQTIDIAVPDNQAAYNPSNLKIA
jgi:hypothetical protein